MRPSPSIVPGIDRDVYLVLDDFGRMGHAWRQTDLEGADLETLIRDLLLGQFSNPIGVIGFSIAEGWSGRFESRSAGAASARLGSTTICQLSCRVCRAVSHRPNMSGGSFCQFSSSAAKFIWSEGMRLAKRLQQVWVKCFREVCYCTMPNLPAISSPCRRNTLSADSPLSDSPWPRPKLRAKNAGEAEGRPVFRAQRRAVVRCMGALPNVCLRSIRFPPQFIGHVAHSGSVVPGRVLMHFRVVAVALAAVLQSFTI